MESTSLSQNAQTKCFSKIFLHIIIKFIFSNGCGCRLLVVQSSLKLFIVPEGLSKPPTCEVIVCKDQMSALDAAKKMILPSDVLLIKGAKKIGLQHLVQQLEESPTNNQVIINLAIIQSNIEEIRAKLSKDARIMVMVKALAYGTDDVRIAKFLKNCGIDIVGVSYVDEGVCMRKAGVSQNIFVLNAADYEVEKAVKWDLEVGVSEPLLIDALQNAAKLHNKKIRVHLHVDTGMSRFGARRDIVLSLAQKIVSSPNLIFEGIMTHFACAEDPNEDAFTLLQVERFIAAIDLLENAGYSPRWRHACNSAAAIRFNLETAVGPSQKVQGFESESFALGVEHSQTVKATPSESDSGAKDCAFRPASTAVSRFTFSQFNMVRLGLAAYGMHNSFATKKALSLIPAISLFSRIVGINDCVKGDSISYGRTHVVMQENARIAVLPIGYFDGLHRNYSGKGYCLIRGQKAPMVGRICMDYMMVDITHIVDAKIGDQVLLFGQDDSGVYISPEELAASGGSIVNELMTCLGPRIRRFFIYDESLRPR